MRLTILLILSVCAFAQTRFVVAIGGIKHESNSFNPEKTVLSDFQSPELESMRNQSTEISGFLEAARDEGFDVYPAYIAGATPKGPLTKETFDTLTERLVQSLKAAPKLDGILLALHGAMVADGYSQADDEIVRRVRNAVGPSIPIIVTHDFHGNPSQELIKLTTALISYQQNPHLDTKLRGRRAGAIMARTLRGAVKPVQVIVKPPMIYNIIFQNTYAEPFLHITKASMDLEQSNPKILSVSVMGGYQYADVPSMGPSVIVVTNGDRQLAEREAKRFGDMLLADRDRIVLNIPDPAAAVKEAMTAPKFPVSLFDTGDNVGGGSPANSTAILEELIKQKATGWVMTIADPAAVQAAIKAGPGAAFATQVGDKPIAIRGKVKSLHDGDFIEPEIRHGGGRYFSMGASAVIEVEGGTRDEKNLLILTTKRIVPYSIHQLVSLGIYPERQKILVAKGTVAPRAAYEPVSAKVILVDSPGSTAVNPARFQFRNARKDLWGLH
jgi:microcystin degradation protein MlrC